MVIQVYIGPLSNGKELVWARTLAGHVFHTEVFKENEECLAGPFVFRCKQELRRARIISPDTKVVGVMGLKLLTESMVVKSRRTVPRRTARKWYTKRPRGQRPITDYFTPNSRFRLT